MKNREWWSVARIGKGEDKRYKLTDAQRDHIRALHRTGMAVREIAREYDGVCSRRLVQLVLFPERAEAIKARAKEVKRWEDHNGKDERREVMRKYRAHIRQVHGEPHRAK